MDNPLRIEKIGQVFIRVKNIDRAIEFYRDTLGLQFLFQTPAMSFFACGEVRLMLGVAEKPEFDHPSSIFYFSVPDIQAGSRHLRGRNVVFDADPHLVARMPDHELWMAFFRDSEDNVLALMSEVRAK